MGVYMESIIFIIMDKEAAKKSTGGLQGITAGDSAISTVGIGLGLNYRGYDIKVNIQLHYRILLNTAHSKRLPISYSSTDYQPSKNSQPLVS